jgi:hypothetical protein
VGGADAITNKRKHKSSINFLRNPYIIHNSAVVEQPLDFARPTAVAPTRSITPEKLKGCPGLIYADETITEIVKIVFALKNLRRAPGTAGRLARIKSNCNATATNTYLTPDGKTSRWPGSMHLVVSVLLGM